MQYFRLKMECGHSYQVSAVSEYGGQPYSPQYIGQTMPSRCCAGSHVVTEQASIPFVVGQPEVIE